MPSKPLFSQHYLERRIQEHPEWAEDVGAPYADLRALYARLRELLPGMNEAQTEAEFIRPVLEQLGFVYRVQPSLHRGGQVQRPDYALYVSQAAKDEAAQHMGDESALYARAAAIADAKYWARPLSEARQDARDLYTNANPSFQMVNYLIGTGVDWGILTNGQIWRLYSRLASSTATEFYEVDLVELLEANDPERFKRFWLFFRAAALVRDARGSAFLERVREGSATYARDIGDRLKDVVFREVFPALAGGFAARLAAQGADVASEEARARLYEATLSLLYKLLFLLYAEARSLLPVDNADYRRYSLTQMAREIAALQDRRQAFSAVSQGYYQRLLGLFRMVDVGDPTLDLPRYNGGLFRMPSARGDARQPADANAFLCDHPLPDAVLAPALDRLARVQGEAVDYGFIGVRHLGAIYEGLLEHRLQVDDPVAGRAYLETDRGERKATGSYYTPDYIVKYIVQHTLEPILRERAARFGALMERIQALRRELQDGRHSVEGIRLRRAELERQEQAAIEALLDIKVCDPAMGSGHFLVEAVDFLTDRLIEILNRYPEDNPVLAWLNRIRGNIVENLRAQGIALDPRRLEDTQLLQRAVMKRCIYGVDLNPMAVELAKVSLWLHSFTVGAPLSFLDHHLRWGNSLIGAMAREVEAERASADQPTLAFLSGPFAGLLRAAEVMRGIGELADATFNEVEQSEQLFRQFDQAATPYKRLLDVYVARHFGVARAQELLEVHDAEALLANLENAAPPYDAVLAAARRLYAAKRFFHWDLEFPEVFIDLERAAWKENPGFDAVVGNPPYVRQEQLGESKGFFRASFAGYHGMADLYAYFIERGARMLQEGGQFGFIVSNKFMRANYGGPLRQFLTSQTRLREVIDFGELPVFAEAATFPAILLFERGPSAGQQSVRVARIKTLDWRDLQDAAQAVCHTVTEDGLADAGWSLAPPAVTGILAKMQRCSIPLEEYVAGEIYRGIITGLNEAFFLDRATRDRLVAADPASAELIKPLIVGDDVRKYEIDYRDRYLLFVRRGTDIDRYPAVRQHLERFRARLEPRPQDHVGPWPGRKPGNYAWYEIQDTIDYWQSFEQPKIVYPEIAREPRFAFDEQAYYTNAKCFIIPKKDLYLLSLLNSNALFQAASLSVAVLGDEFAGGRLQLQWVNMQRLPIRRIPFSTPQEERAQHAAQAAALYAQGLAHLTPGLLPGLAETRARFSTLLAAVDAHLSAQPERADVLHDLLAHLAERMLALNKEKQAEVQGFIAWLERELGAPLAALSHKSRLQNYLGDYQKGEAHLPFAEMLELLRKNRRKLRVDPSARAFQERLAQEYQASLDKLLPIKAQLAATDRLIDQLVYQLYGLTEEEIAIVEGVSS